MSWLLGLKIGERFLAAGGIEDVVLFDFDPGEQAALRCDGVTLASELLFAGQEFFAGYEPFFSRDYFGLFLVDIFAAAFIFVAPFVRVWVGNFFRVVFLAKQLHGQCRQPSGGSCAGDDQPHAC
jgi:hypothetical protein